MFRRQRILTTPAVIVFRLCPETSFCETPSIWGGKQNTPCSGFAKGLRFLDIVMTFVLTPLSHYNSITEPHARFLLSLLQDHTIDFLTYFITSILDVYQDTVTCDKLIFPSVITRILRHSSIPIPDSPYFTTMGAIDAGSVRRSKAQLLPKRPHVESTGPVASAVPSTSAPSSSAGDVTLEAIIVQLQCMNARLDTLSNELCQVNTRVSLQHDDNLALVVSLPLHLLLQRLWQIRMMRMVMMRTMLALPMMMR